MKNLSMIAAVAADGAIGKRGELLCHLPADLRRFKELTTGHAVLMGRRTFDSLPKGALPNRRNVVITRDAAFAAERVEAVHSVEEALALLAGEDEVFVIGGEQIYRALLPAADRLYITHIEASFAGADAFFPEVDWAEWEEERRESHLPDERHQFAYAFADYRRRR